MAEKKESLLKRWSVWYEPYVEDYYVVLKIYGKKVTIQWLSDNKKYSGYKYECYDDVFIRMLTPLEKELL